MCMDSGGGGSRTPSAAENQATLDIQNGVVKEGSNDYLRARLASSGFARGAGYRSPTESLLAPAGDTTYLG